MNLRLPKGCESAKWKPESPVFAPPHLLGPSLLISYAGCSRMSAAQSLLG